MGAETGETAGVCTGSFRQSRRIKRDPTWTKWKVRADFEELSSDSCSTIVEPHIHLGSAGEVVGKERFPGYPDLPKGAVSQPACRAHCEGTVLDHPLQLPSGHQVGTPAPAGEPSCLQVQALRAVLRLQQEELPCTGREGYAMSGPRLWESATLAVCRC